MSGVRRESVGHASRTVCVFRGAECVVVRICGCVCVVVYVCVFFYNKNIPTLLALLECSKLFASWRIVFGGLSALRLAQGPQCRSLAVSGARLCGWLACGGFQTLLALMILSAGQQKGHLSSWRRLPLRRGRSSWMVRVRE